MDLLLALVPLTIVLGMSANAISGVTTQIQDYIYIYSMQRVTNDAIDALVKSRGTPPDWNYTNPPNIVGLARNDTETNLQMPVWLDKDKVRDMNVTFLEVLLNRQYPYFNLSIVDLNETHYFTRSWSRGSRADASNIVAIERRALLDITNILNEIHQISHGDYEASNYCCIEGPGAPRIYKFDFFARAGHNYTLYFSRDDTGTTIRYKISTEGVPCPPEVCRWNTVFPPPGPGTQVFTGNELETTIDITDEVTIGTTNYVYIRVSGNPNNLADAFILEDGTTPLNLGTQPVCVILEVGR